MTVIVAGEGRRREGWIERRSRFGVCGGLFRCVVDDDDDHVVVVIPLRDLFQKKRICEDYDKVDGAMDSFFGKHCQRRRSWL